jgi:hypothetical protein
MTARASFRQAFSGYYTSSIPNAGSITSRSGSRPCCGVSPILTRWSLLHHHLSTERSLLALDAIVMATMIQLGSCDGAHYWACSQSKGIHHFESPSGTLFKLNPSPRVMARSPRFYQRESRIPVITVTQRGFTFEYSNNLTELGQTYRLYLPTTSCTWRLPRRKYIWA